MPARPADTKKATARRRSPRSEIIAESGRVSPLSYDTCCSSPTLRKPCRPDYGRYRTSYGTSRQACAFPLSNSVVLSWIAATACRDRPCNHSWHALRASDDRRSLAHSSLQTLVLMEQPSPEPASSHHTREHRKQLPPKINGAYSNHNREDVTVRSLAPLQPPDPAKAPRWKHLGSFFY